MRASKYGAGRAVVAAAALSAAVFCGQAQADVLEQTPTTAAAVLEVKNLDSLGAKVAKLSKALGVDELAPDLKDPLNALLTKGHMTKGVNKAGDAAIIIFVPDKEGKEETPVALIPVSDYDGFVSNFEKADGGPAAGDFTAVKDPEGNKTLYIAHRGEYALVGDHAAKFETLGLKLTGAAAHEVDSKDLTFIVNTPEIRDRFIPELKAHRQEWIDQLNKSVEEQAAFKPFVPVIDTLAGEAFDGAETFLEDADAVVFSLQLSDEGILGGGLVQFKQGSTCGNVVEKIKPGDTPLLAGLPNQKYFFFGGGSGDSTALEPVVEEVIDPLIKELKAVENNEPAAKIVAILETVKELSGAHFTHSAGGWISPTKPLGQESLFQQVSVVYGDAKAMATGEKKLLEEANDLTALIPNGAKSKIVFGEPKTVDGVELQTYSTKLDMDQNDPKAVQAQQVLSLLFGPQGMNGSFGLVNDKTFLIAQGVSDDLLKELIAAAKDGSDVLSGTPAVKTVHEQLPKNASAEYYVALDNIVTTSVRYAQGFGLPIKLTLPADLPPIGISAGAEGTVFRASTFIPTQTVQSIIAAGLQAYTQMQGGKGGGV